MLLSTIIITLYCTVLYYSAITTTLHYSEITHFINYGYEDDELKLYITSHRPDKTSSVPTFLVEFIDGEQSTVQDECIWGAVC